jgi:hypothetical protein
MTSYCQMCTWGKIYWIFSFSFWWISFYRSSSHIHTHWQTISINILPLQITYTEISFSIFPPFNFSHFTVQRESTLICTPLSCCCSYAWECRIVSLVGFNGNYIISYICTRCICLRVNEWVSWVCVFVEANFTKLWKEGDKVRISVLQGIYLLKNTKLSTITSFSPHRHN